MSLSTATRIRLGVVGLGLVAQVVHLPNLRRLADRYAVTHACEPAMEPAREAIRRIGAIRLPGSRHGPPPGQRAADRSRPMTPVGVKG